MGNSKTLSFTDDAEFSQEREDDLTGRLVAYNEGHAPLWAANHDDRFSASPLHLYVLERGRVVGGLVGRTHVLRNWFEVSVLWVDEAFRGAGLGRELMERGEAEALRRGCRYVRLATSQYQAPGFYEKIGYALYGKLEECPPGDTTYYFMKALGSVR